MMKLLHPGRRPSKSLLPAELPPPLKWAGGKRWLIPRLRELWKPYTHRRLVEPFVGGAAVALGLRPARALLNDANQHLSNFYCWLQRGLYVEIELAYDRGLYERHRARFNQLTASGAAESAEAASLFYYLNRTGYNGLCRFNRSGGFNVPFGRYKSVNYTRDFTPYAEVLRDWQFTVGDFDRMQLQPDDFLYVDPPYDVEFTAYNPGGFTWADQQRLAHWLAAHPGPAVVSNQATPRILQLYRQLGFTIEVIQAPRMIACNGDRAKVGEMLATKSR